MFTFIKSDCFTRLFRKAAEKMELLCSLTLRGNREGEVEVQLGVLQVP